MSRIEHRKLPVRQFAGYATAATSPWQVFKLVQLLRRLHFLSNGGDQPFSFRRGIRNVACGIGCILLMELTVMLPFTIFAIWLGGRFLKW